MQFRNIFWGVLLILAGSLFYIRDTTMPDIMRYFWPAIFITAGGLLLIRNQIKEKN